MKDLQPQQSFYKKRRHVSYPLQSKTAEILRHRLPSIHLYFFHYLPPFSLLIRSIMWVVYLKSLFLCIIQWNNSKTTNSQSLGCKRISTRPTRKNRTFSRQLFGKMSDQTSDIPKGDLTLAGERNWNLSRRKALNTLLVLVQKQMLKYYHDL